MDADTCRYITDQIKSVELEASTQAEIDKQLDAELQLYLQEDHKDGTTESLMFQRLPPEVRSQIFAHVVRVEQSVHIFPPKGNEKFGFRLSLCEETSYDFDLGNCKCDENRVGTTVQPEFFNNALFLVSRGVRREALDAFFMTNKFTFTCIYELLKFTTMFSSSCSKIQHLRIFERVDDYPSSDFRLEGLQNARLALKALKHLDLHLFLSTWTAYEELYEDGLIHQMLHFAIGPPPPSTKRKRGFADMDFGFSSFDGEVPSPKRFKLDTTGFSKSVEEQPQESDECSGASGAKGKGKAEPLSPISSIFGSGSRLQSSSPRQVERGLHEDASFRIPPLRTFKADVRTRTRHLALYNRSVDPKQAYFDALSTKLINHLTDVFMDAGQKYKSVEDIPSLGPKPKARIREEDKPLTDKRGILYMRD